MLAQIRAYQGLWVCLRLQKESEQNLVLVLGKVLGLQSCSLHEENCVGLFFFHHFS
jgi:hypothetical protein